MPIDFRRIALGLALSLAGCDRADQAPVPAPTTTASPTASGAHGVATADSALGELSQSFASAARRAMAQIPDDAGATHPSYLAARHDVAAGSPFWRRQAPTGSEILIGPPVSALEAGGAMALLDAALTAGDVAGVRRYRVDAERALLHIEHELGYSPLRASLALPALSGATYDLGLRILDAAPGAPDGLAALHADLTGALDGIERSLEILARGTPIAPKLASRLRSLGEPIRAVEDEAFLIDRGRWVVETGELGAEVRELASHLGIEAPLPYEPRFPVRGGGAAEPVHALTLPAARKTLRPVPAEETARLVALGERLFSDPRLSKARTRSCSTCHIPARGFADGLVRPRALGAGAISLRHTPTLLYSPLFASQLWDGRRITRESQALGVIHSPAEMGLAEGELLEAIRMDEFYRGGFASIPGGLSEANVARALGAFQVARMVPGTAPIDRFARGDRDALTALQSGGLDVFAGRGRCTRCHVPPSFGGVRPRDFSTPVYAVIGVPTRFGGTEVDPDPGRFAVTKRPLDRGSFKTPTVRNVAVTAPYFHNGAFAELGQVIDFYDTGGIVGAPEPIEHLDPDIRKLDLSAEEKRALDAFLRDALLDPQR